MIVRDDRQAPTQERQDGMPADKRSIPIVVGVHGHGRVAQQRLGSRGRDRDPGVGVGPAIGSLEVIADRPQRARLITMDVLQVADRGEAARAPVDERLAAVDEAGVPEALEGDADGACRAVVHREALAAPVDAGAEPSMLGPDDVACLVHEPMHPLEISLSPERRARLALLGDDPIEDELRADAGVVDARQPQGVVAAHAVVADEGVLDRRDQRMADVERSRHVGWRLDDDEPLRVGWSRASRCEGVGVQPALVDARFDRGGVVARGQLASRRHGSTPRSITHKARSSKDERAVVPPSFTIACRDRLISALSGGPVALACDLLPRCPRRALSQ